MDSPLVAVSDIPEGVRLTFNGPVQVELGEIDQTVKSVVAKAPRKVELDLHKTAYISSLGIGLLIGLAKQIRANGGDVQIVAIHRLAYDVLKTTGLTEIFNVQESAIRGHG